MPEPLRRAAGAAPSRILLAFALLFAAAAVPMLSVDLPPLLDYPNHLARMAVLAAGGGDAGFARYYTVHWAALPNLAMDGVVPELARVLPLFLAGRLFLLFVLFLLASGPVALHRAVWGRWSAWPLLGFFFLYNRILLWGFVNFLAGIGLALWVAALWVMLDRRPVRRALLGAPAALMVFFCHIEAFGLLALLLIGLEALPLQAALRARAWHCIAQRAGVLFLAFLAPGVIFLLGWRPAAGSVDYAHLWRKADLLFTVMDNYSRPFDIFCFVLLLGLGVAGLWRRRVVVSPRLGLPLALILLAYLAVPTTLYSGSAADRRVPVMLALLFVAATAPRLAEGRKARLLAAGLLLLFALRLGVVEGVWRHAETIYRADIAVLNQLPEGARLAIAAPGEAIGVTAAPELHLPVLAVPLRHAFVPSFFAYPTQQPVVLTPMAGALAALDDPGALWTVLAEGDRRALLPVLRAYDDVLVVDRRPIRLPAEPCLVFVAGSARFRLYRILHHAAGCGLG